MSRLCIFMCWGLISFSADNLGTESNETAAPGATLAALVSSFTRRLKGGTCRLEDLFCPASLTDIFLRGLASPQFDTEAESKWRF